MTPVPSLSSISCILGLLTAASRAGLIPSTSSAEIASRDTTSTLASPAVNNVVPASVNYLGAGRPILGTTFLENVARGVGIAKTQFPKLEVTRVNIKSYPHTQRPADGFKRLEDLREMHIIFKNPAASNQPYEIVSSFPWGSWDNMPKALEVTSAEIAFDPQTVRLTPPQAFAKINAAHPGEILDMAILSEKASFKNIDCSKQPCYVAVLSSLKDNQVVVLGATDETISTETVTFTPALLDPLPAISTANDNHATPVLAVS